MCVPTKQVPNSLVCNYELILPLLSSGDGPANWSTEGIITEVLEDGRVRCHTHHLTSFAVLLSATGGEAIAVRISLQNMHNATLLIIIFLQNDKVLSILTKISLSFSVVCLLLTVIFFLTYG